MSQTVGGPGRRVVGGHAGRPTGIRYRRTVGAAAAGVGRRSALEASLSATRIRYRRNLVTVGALRFAPCLADETRCLL